MAGVKLWTRSRMESEPPWGLPVGWASARRQTMADLTTNFAGIHGPNPFWLASAPPTNCGEQVMRAFDAGWGGADRKSTRLNSSHMSISYAVFCLKKKKKK